MKKFWWNTKKLRITSLILAAIMTLTVMIASIFIRDATLLQKLSFLGWASCLSMTCAYYFKEFD